MTIASVEASGRALLAALGTVALVALGPLALAAQEAVTTAEAPPEVPLEVYVAVRGQTTGPFDRAGLEAQVAAGKLTGETYVWQQGMEEWLHAVDVPDVAALLVTPPPEPLFTVDDPAEYLAGHWTFSTDDMEIEGGFRGTAHGELHFTADGRIAVMESVDVTVPEALTINLTARGTYTVTTLSPTSFTVTPQAEAVYTAEGIEPINKPFTDVITIEVLDADTFLDDDGITASRVE